MCRPHSIVRTPLKVIRPCINVNACILVYIHLLVGSLQVPCRFFALYKCIYKKVKCTAQKGRKITRKGGVAVQDIKVETNTQISVSVRGRACSKLGSFSSIPSLPISQKDLIGYCVDHVV